MKIRNKLFLIFFLILVITMSWKLNHLNKPVNLSQKLDPKVTAQQILGRIPYKVSSEASKKNIEYIFMDIDKNALSRDDLSRIEKQLTQTWQLVEKTQYDHIYCKDAWNEIVISQPVSQAGERDQNYKQRFNTDKYQIFIVWQSYGTDACIHLLNNG